MAYKKKVTNKAEKVEAETKAPKKIDWNKIEDNPVIIGLSGKHLTVGKEYQISKETARILVEKGVAKLK